MHAREAVAVEMINPDPGFCGLPEARGQPSALHTD